MLHCSARTSEFACVLLSTLSWKTWSSTWPLRESAIAVAVRARTEKVTVCEPLVPDGIEKHGRPKSTPSGDRLRPMSSSCVMSSPSKRVTPEITP